MFGLSARTLAAAILLLPMLAGCAQFETGQSKMRAVKTVGIVSAIGDEFSYTKAGLMAGGSADRRVAIASWGLDDLIVRQAAGILSQRFQVRPLTYDRAVFAAAAKTSPITIVNMMSEDSLKARLRAELSSQPLDAYVVIVKAKSPFGPSNRTVEGIGALDQGTMVGSYRQIHALYKVRVLDGHSLDVLEERSAAPLDGSDPVRLAGPSLSIDQASMPVDGDPVRDAKLRASVTAMIERSLPLTLRDLRLTNEP